MRRELLMLRTRSDCAQLGQMLRPLSLPPDSRLDDQLRGGSWDATAKSLEYTKRL